MDKKRLLNVFLAILLVSFAVFALISVITYNPSDPPFADYPESSATKNLCGWVGAVLSGYGLSWLGLAAFATWLLAAYMFRISSLSALIAALFTPFYGWLWLKSGVLVAAVAVLSLLLMWRHKSNIQNLLSGKERAIGKTQPGDSPPE